MLLKTIKRLLLLIGLSALNTAADNPHSDELLTHLASQVQAGRLRGDVETLVSFGTRHTLSDTQSATRGIGAARRWIATEFNRISSACDNCLEVITVADFVEGEDRIPKRTEVVNVIAIQRGSLDPDRVVMMSGDIDSRVSDVMNFTADAPGANDNASGVAGVLEAARVLSKQRFTGTIVYAALSGEEQGLFGGKILADYALARGWRVKAVLNNDMIGNIQGIDGVIDNSTARVFSEGTRVVETESEARTRRFSGGEVDSASRNLARYIDKLADNYLTSLDVMMIYRLDRFGRGGHHRPFNEAGMPGVRIMETHENYNRQHQDLRVENGIAYGDVIEGVDFDYVAKLTSLNIITLASLAGAPPFPAEVTISGAVLPSTTLKWAETKGKAGENLAGYKIYWRLTTEPQWTYSRWVGKVNTYTLNNIVIDNYLFGVASVAVDGFESPVVFPDATGSFGE